MRKGLTELGTFDKLLVELATLHLPGAIVLIVDVADSIGGSIFTDAVHAVKGIDVAVVGHAKKVDLVAKFTALGSAFMELLDADVFEIHHVLDAE